MELPLINLYYHNHCVSPIAHTASPLIQSPSSSSVATTNSHSSSSGSSVVTNAVVVAGGEKHGVGAGNNIISNTAAVQQHNTSNQHSGKSSRSSLLSQTEDIVKGDQLETNSLARLRSSDSFRYAHRIMNYRGL